MKKKPVPRQLLNHHVLAFVKSTRALFRLIHDAEASTDAKTFWTKANRLLAEIYAHGSNLPKVRPKLWDHSRDNPRQLQIYSKTMLHSKHMHRLYSSCGSFWTTFDPFDEKSQCLGSTRDCFMGIVSDLHDSMLLMNSRDESKKLLAVYHWREGIQSHTGWHITEMLRVLLFYLSNDNHVAVGENFGLKNSKIKKRRRKKP